MESETLNQLANNFNREVKPEDQEILGKATYLFYKTSMCESGHPIEDIEYELLPDHEQKAWSFASVMTISGYMINEQNTMGKREPSFVE